MVSPNSAATFHFRNVILVAALTLMASFCRPASAFTTPPTLTQREPTDVDALAVKSKSPSPRLKEEGLRLNSFFDDVGKFFEQMGGKDDSNESESDEDDNEYAGATRLLTIPAKSIKPGGLRLLLMFYLMGQQNTPEPGSWKADQPTTDEYVVDMYYHDRTAALMVKLTEDEISIDRIGSAPSNAYLMQESIIIDGILDELQVCVTQVDIKDEDRLLLLPEPQDAIEKARESLAFG